MDLREERKTRPVTLSEWDDHLSGELAIGNAVLGPEDYWMRVWDAVEETRHYTPYSQTIAGACLATCRALDDAARALDRLFAKAEVGDEFYTGHVARWDNGYESIVVGQVVAVHGELVVWTPIYDSRHEKVYSWASHDAVREGKRWLEQERRDEWEQQAAEIRAETNIPQHLVW